VGVWEFEVWGLFALDDFFLIRRLRWGRRAVAAYLYYLHRLSLFSTTNPSDPYRLDCHSLVYTFGRVEIGYQVVSCRISLHASAQNHYSDGREHGKLPLGKFWKLGRDCLFA
jgi:hypothetical protein